MTLHQHSGEGYSPPIAQTEYKRAGLVEGLKGPEKASERLAVAGEIFAQTLKPGAQFEQALHGAAVEAIVDLHHSGAIEHVRSVVYMAKRLSQNEGRSKENGIFGEVATYLALEAMQFQVTFPTPEQDLNGIDMWVTEADDAPNIAVQVKSSRRATSVEIFVVHDAGIPEFRAAMDRQEQYIPGDFYTSSTNMVNYLQRLQDKTPGVLIRIPGGDKDVTSFNTSHGAPTVEFINELRDKMFDVVWGDEDY